MSDQPRYFVDERTGIVAVRDRTLTDPEYPGLHYDTAGVVWSRMWKRLPQAPCPTCHHQPDDAWALDPADVGEAHRVADELNAAVVK
jgi:hypothetical protein